MIAQDFARVGGSEPSAGEREGKPLAREETQA